MFFHTRKLPDKKIQVKLNNSYVLEQFHQLYGFIETIVPLIQNKNQISVFPKQFNIHLYSSLEMMLQEKLQEMCSICIQPIQRKHIIEQQLEVSSSKDGYCLQCKHVFHQGCLQDYINKNSWFNCPKCAKIYGKMLGDMPNGLMSSSIDKVLKCSGYQQFQTIVIKYQMFEGQVNKQKYNSADFLAYIPNNQQGQKIAKMLQQCFRRKLTFIIRQNQYKNMVIQWSGIPHKTATVKSKNDENGYPDAQYLNRAHQYMIGLGII